MIGIFIFLSLILRNSEEIPSSSEPKIIAVGFVKFALYISSFVFSVHETNCIPESLISCKLNLRFHVLQTGILCKAPDDVFTASAFKAALFCSGINIV